MSGRSPNRLVVIIRALFVEACAGWERYIKTTCCISGCRRIDSSLQRIHLRKKTSACTSTIPNRSYPLPSTPLVVATTTLYSLGRHHHYHQNDQRTTLKETNPHHRRLNSRPHMRLLPFKIFPLRCHHSRTQSKPPIKRCRRRHPRCRCQSHAPYGSRGEYSFKLYA